MYLPDELNLILSALFVPIIEYPNCLYQDLPHPNAQSPQSTASTLSGYSYPPLELAKKNDENIILLPQYTKSSKKWALQQNIREYKSLFLQKIKGLIWNDWMYSIARMYL